MLKKISLPLTDETIKDLHAGDNVLLTGVIYVARDAAHRRMVESLDSQQPLPFDIEGQTVYYMGPAPAKPGQVIGSAGPTTSGRMDSYSPRLIEAGLRGMIGKGNRSKPVRDAIVKCKAVYFAATGGAAALISKSIKKAEVVAYEDLGAEAIRRLEVVDFPCIVAQDCHGQNYYEIGVAKYRRA